MPNQNEFGFNEVHINLTALMESMVEGVILQDSAGKIIQYNHAALEILGLTKEQLNDRILEGLTESDLKEWEKTFPGKNHIGMESLKTGKIQRDIVLKIFRFDGEVRWISMNAVPIIRESQSTSSQLICTFTDITEMRRILNDLRQVQLLFNISQDLMIIANLEGYFKRVNPQFVKVLGYTQREIISQKFLNFVHQEDLAATELVLQKLLSKKETVHFINRYKNKDNEYRIFDWLVVLDSETNLIYFTARDITDYRAEELDIIHSSKVYSLGEITSGIAYSLNNQLSIISGQISILQTRIEQGQIEPLDLKSKVKNIEESIKTISKITKQLSSLTRNIENERVGDFSLTRILDNVVGLCKERFRIHDVKLKIQLEGELVIHSRESQVVHILLAILNNAYNIVHSQRDSWVELSGTVSNKIVRISVTNSSPLTDAVDLKNLNLPKGMIEENFGKIYIDRTSSNTRFVIEFPQGENFYGEK